MEDNTNINTNNLQLIGDIDLESYIKHNECMICLSEYSHNDNIGILECNHIFHHDCINVWLLNYSNKCPYCKKKSHYCSKICINPTIFKYYYDIFKYCFDIFIKILITLIITVKILINILFVLFGFAIILSINYLVLFIFIPGINYIWNHK